MTKLNWNKLNHLTFLRLFKNFSYLLFANGINFILPIVIVPFLIKKIGLANYGKIAMAQAFMMVLLLVTDYSFNISGTKEASIERNNLPELQKLFNTILSSKLLLLGASFLIMVVTVQINPHFRDERLLIFLSFGMVIGRTILPSWFFQGIEKMQFIALFNFISKIVLTASILLLVSKKEDYFYVNFLYGLGDILTGVFSWFILSRYHNIKIKLVSIAKCIVEIKNGFGLFTTNIAVNFTSYTNVIILSSFVSSSAVGIYSVAEKVMLISKQIIGMLSQAVFPHVCKVATESEKKLLKFTKVEIILSFFVFSIFGVLLFIFADKISFFFIKKISLDTIKFIKFLSIVPLVVSLNTPIFQYLLVKDYQKEYISLFLSATLFSILSNYILIPLHGSMGTIISIICTEMLITIGLYIIFIYKKKKGDQLNLHE